MPVTTLCTAMPCTYSGGRGVRRRKGGRVRYVHVLIPLEKTGKRDETRQRLEGVQGGNTFTRRGGEATYSRCKLAS